VKAEAMRLARGGDLPHVFPGGFELGNHHLLDHAVDHMFVAMRDQDGTLDLADLLLSEALQFGCMEFHRILASRWPVGGYEGVNNLPS
jgi:hypothetical protein